MFTLDLFARSFADCLPLVVSSLNLLSDLKGYKREASSFVNQRIGLLLNNQR